jgi:hypothetical protein
MEEGGGRDDTRPRPAVPAGADRNRVRWQTAPYDSPVRVKQFAADGAGVFRATGVLTDTYLVAAVTSPPEYLDTLVPSTVPVPLRSGEKRAVDLLLR